MDINTKNLMAKSIEWLKGICEENTFVSILEKTQSFFENNIDFSKIKPLIEQYDENFKINLFTAYILIYICSNKYPDEIWGNNIGDKIFDYFKRSKETQMLFDSLPITNDLKRLNNDQLNEIYNGIKGSLVGSLYNVSNLKNYNVIEELTYAAVYKEKPGGNIYTTPIKWLNFLETIYETNYLLKKEIIKKDINLKKWELHSVTIKGEHHKKCDDSSSVINFSDKNWCAYSADGLGSRSMSHIGSKIAGESFINCIKKMRKTLKFTFENVYTDKMMYYIQNGLAKDIAKNWNKKVIKYIKENQLDKQVDDFASTLLIAYGCEKFIACGIIGDGNLIIEKKPTTSSNEFGYTYMEDSFSDVVQKSVLNMTHLVKNPSIMQFRFFNPKEISGIILASDGANAIKFKNINGVLFANMGDLLNCSEIFNELRNLSFKNTSDYLENLCQKYSSGNKYGGGRGDDCSIVYIKYRR